MRTTHAMGAKEHIYFHNRKVAGSYAAYLCRDWNARHNSEEQLRQLSIYYVLELTLPNYAYLEPKKELVWVSECP